MEKKLNYLENNSNDFEIILMFQAEIDLKMSRFRLNLLNFFPNSNILNCSTQSSPNRK